MDHVVEGGGRVRGLEPDRTWSPNGLELRDAVRWQRQTGSVVPPCLATLFRQLAFAAQALGRAIAVVGKAVRHEAGCRVSIAVETIRLEVRAMRTANSRAFIPVEPEPPQAIQDAGDHVGRGAFDVGVFDSQHEGAAKPSGVQPVEQRRAGAAYVEIAGWRRCESNARAHRGIIP